MITVDAAPTEVDALPRWDPTPLFPTVRSRFLFESRLFARRRTSTPAVRELSELMREAQVEAYGARIDAFCGAAPSAAPLG